MYIGQYLHIKTIYTIQHDKLKFQIFISDQATRHTYILYYATGYERFDL